MCREKSAERKRRLQANKHTSFKEATACVMLTGVNLAQYAARICADSLLFSLVRGTAWCWCSMGVTGYSTQE